MCSTEPHPANCLADLKKKKKPGRKNSQSQSWPFTQGKEITKGASFFKMQDFNHDLQTVASFPKYSWRRAMLLHSLCFILSSSLHCIISLCSSSTSQGTQKATGSQVCWLSPSGCFLRGRKSRIIGEEEVILTTETSRLGPATWGFSQVSRCLIQ